MVFFHLSRPLNLKLSGSLQTTITKHNFSLILTEDQLGKAKYTPLKSQPAPSFLANIVIRSSHHEWGFITILLSTQETINTPVLSVTRNLWELSSTINTCLCTGSSTLKTEWCSLDHPIIVAIGLNVVFVSGPWWRLRSKVRFYLLFQFSDAIWGSSRNKYPSEAMLQSPFSGPDSRKPLNASNVLYPCKVCQKPFKSRMGRYYHMAVHTGKFKHHCVICDKKFMQTPAFDKHMLWHRKQFSAPR